MTCKHQAIIEGRDRDQNIKYHSLRTSSRLVHLIQYKKFAVVITRSTRKALRMSTHRYTNAITKHSSRANLTRDPTMLSRLYQTHASPRRPFALNRSNNKNHVTHNDKLDANLEISSRSNPESTHSRSMVFTRNLPKTPSTDYFGNTTRAASQVQA